MTVAYNSQENFAKLLRRFEFAISQTIAASFALKTQCAGKEVENGGRKESF